ncbi:hypothetical protein GGQ64_002581 [Rhizobium azooxidifex]|uniref:Uncharacterized protein n=1 Tax=Mycoplana azooxidifex TaxID=1636188 RepID=A0A7W6GJB3_9HYPH|nr:hypothetical protein [Mycoplana azooxidifex]MBB3977375.1 hypothetical protein [Mycoplana azooxidifex]
MRSTVDVDVECLPQICAAFEMVGIRVIGSEACGEAVRLIVEGDIIPDAPLVTVTIDRVIGTTAATITARATPVDPA